MAQNVFSKIVLKLFARLFRIEQVKASKTVSVGAVYEQEKGETETKSLPGDLKDS